MRAAPFLPIPVPDGAPDWLLGVVFVAGGAVVLGVLIWQAVRYFRDQR